MDQRKKMADDIDRYRIKNASTDAERLEVLEHAIDKAMERARMNYLWITLSVAVFLVTFAQTLRTFGFDWIPDIAFKWSLVTMTILIVLPWQLRKLRAIS